MQESGRSGESIGGECNDADKVVSNGGVDLVFPLLSNGPHRRLQLSGAEVDSRGGEKM